MEIDYSNIQKEVIDFERGNLQVIACAGSGKTDVITRRIAKLVSKCIADPQEIIAFTFTEKAAEEMKFRIRQHLEELRPSDPELGDMYVGTIHSFCFDLLRDIKPEYRQYEALDEHSRIAFVSDYSNYYQLKLNDLDERSYRNFEKFCRSADLVREEMIDVEELPSDFKKCYKKYREQLDKQKFMDFSEMIYRTVELLEENREFSEEVRNRYEFVVVDEYQDVNPLQERLIELVSGKSDICVVGDDDQCIYQWRGTTVENILTFSDRYPDVDTKRIATNYRSTEAIVNSGREVIERNPERLEKPIEAWSERENEFEEGDLYTLSFNEQENEIEFVLDKIEELRGTKYVNNKGEEFSLDYRDMVIFFRSVGTSAGPYLNALDENGIDYIVKGGGMIFDQEEVRLAVESIAFLGGYSYGAGDTTSDSLISLYEESFGDRGDPIDFIRNLERLKDSFDEDTFIDLQETYQLILSYMGLGRTEFSESELYNLGQLSQAISDFQYVHGRIKLSGIKYFLGFLQGYGERKYELETEEDPTKVNAVKVMTLHRAKGLQFPIVFMPNLVSGRFPSTAPDRDWYIPDSLFDSERYSGTIADERRLFYVGVTRSEKFLSLSWSENLKDRKMSYDPSIFLREFPKKYALTENVVDPTHREPMELTEGRGIEDFPTSYSELRYFERCPYDYDLRFVYGFNPKISPALGYGRCVHNVLNAIHTNYQEESPDEDEIEIIVDENSFFRYAPPSVEENFQESIEELAKTYVNNYAGDLQLVLDSEKPFEFALADSVLVSGSIDLIKRINEKGDVEGIEIVDFKNREDDELTSDYKRQLRLYALASKKALEWSPEKATVHHLDDNSKEEIKINESELQKVEEEIMNTVKNIRRGHFPKNPEPDKCNNCDWKYICSKQEDNA